MIEQAKNLYNQGKMSGKMAVNAFGASEGGTIQEVTGSVVGLIFLAFLLPVGYNQVDSANLSNVPGGDFIATAAFALISVAAGIALVMNIVDSLDMDI